MPSLILRDEAIARIAEARGDAPCLMCAIVQRRVGPVYALFEDQVCLVSLPRYVRRWGQVLVTPKGHLTRFSDISPELWGYANELAHRAARVVERVRSPRRIYLASTGSSAGELVNCSVHLHIHVVPLYDAEDRPSDIFSWQEGIYVAEEPEWEALQASYLAEW